MRHFWYTYLLAVCTVTTPVFGDNFFGPYEAEYLGTTDGDTIDVILHVYPGMDITTTIRERSVDTPELRRVPECEKVIARQAKAFTKELMESARYITVEELGYGTFQPRMVGRIYVNNKPLGSLLKEQGLAVDYDKRKDKEWCNG